MGTENVILNDINNILKVYGLYVNRILLFKNKHRTTSQDVFIIWMFIQFFEMSTEYDQTYTTINTLLSELEVREQGRH